MRRWHPLVFTATLALSASLFTPATAQAVEDPALDGLPRSGQAVEVHTDAVLRTVQARAGNSDVAFTWPTGPVAVGQPAYLTVSGVGLTTTTHVYVHDSDMEDPNDSDGRVIASGDITPTSPTLTLTIPTDRLGVRSYYVEVEEFDGYEGWIGDDYADIEVVGSPSTITATIPSGSYEANEKGRAVTGTVSGRRGRLVQIQSKGTNGTWVPLAEGHASRDGSFSIPTPTWWVGTQTLRAYAPATAVDTEAATTNTGTAKVARTYKPRGGTAFTYLSPERARWNPCQPITYRVNPRLLPAGGLAEIKRAFKAVSQASGLRFTYVGTTTFIPLRKGQSVWAFPDNADFVVAWSTPQVVPGLGGNVAGRGGARWSGAYDQEAELSDGSVVLDATQRLGRTKAEERQLRASLLLHEVAHAVGLLHVNDERQIMYHTLVRGQAPQFAAGDLRGLDAVGAAKGCVVGSSR